MLKHFGGEVYRVDGDDAKLDNYIYQHTKSPSLAKELKDVHFRDDKLASIGVPAGQLGAIRHLGAIATSGVALQTSAGFFDMGVARTSILLFKYLTNTLDADTALLLPELPKEALEALEKDATHHRLTLGPWSHAGVDNADPFAQSKLKCFYHLDERWEPPPLALPAGSHDLASPSSDGEDMLDDRAAAAEPDEVQRMLAPPGRVGGMLPDLPSGGPAPSAVAPRTATAAATTAPEATAAAPAEPAHDHVTTARACAEPMQVEPRQQVKQGR
ncbi:hypothetical protein PI126_g15514 [Phytophthora idaei]|nr:hypothetical protein PI126_g15514 [Phytophthora idaei]